VWSNVFAWTSKVSHIYMSDSNSTTAGKFEWFWFTSIITILQYTPWYWVKCSKNCLNVVQKWFYGHISYFRLWSNVRTSIVNGKFSLISRSSSIYNILTVMNNIHTSFACICSNNVSLFSGLITSDLIVQCHIKGEHVNQRIENELYSYEIAMQLRNMCSNEHRF
jgi:hypothetical protein